MVNIQSAKSVMLTLPTERDWRRDRQGLLILLAYPVGVPALAGAAVAVAAHLSIRLGSLIAGV